MSIKWFHAFMSYPLPLFSFSFALSLCIAFKDLRNFWYAISPGCPLPCLYLISLHGIHFGAILAFHQCYRVLGSMVDWNWNIYLDPIQVSVQDKKKCRRTCCTESCWCFKNFKDVSSSSSTGYATIRRF